MTNKIVVHFRDGRVLKGSSTDVYPNRPTFHFAEVDTSEPQEIRLADLKGVFFVKQLEGTTSRPRRYDLERPGMGRRVRVRFADGEVVEGYTSGYSADRLAFFVFPPDPEDNTDRMMVVTEATTEVSLI